MRSRVPHGANERLEPYEGKLSRTVLRGVGSGNTARLPDHPTQDVTPSPDDILLTRQVIQAGELLDITLLDHLIVSQTRFTSMRERRLGWEY